MPRAFRKLPHVADLANFNWFPKSHAERLLPLRAEPEQLPMFHLGGRPGTSPEAMAEREALSQVTRLRDKRMFGTEAPQEFLEPGEIPKTYAALRDAKELAPHLFEEVGEWTYGGMPDPATLGMFSHDPELQGVIRYDPTISPEKLKAHKVMAGLPAGDIKLGEESEGRGYEEALNTILHELSHAQTAVDNPRWASDTYQDTIMGFNTEVGPVQKRQRGYDVYNPQHRYMYHPDELKAMSASQGYSRLPLPPGSQLPGGPTIHQPSLQAAYREWAQQKELDRRRRLGDVAQYQDESYMPDVNDASDFDPAGVDYPYLPDPDGFFRRT